MNENICLSAYIIYSMIFVSLLTSGFLLYRYKKLNLYSRLLRELSITDKLTKIYNRLKIDTELESEFKRYKRSKESFCVILIDIDFFKNINDTYGHLVGDSVLIELSKLLKDNLREVDMLGRWGGEEFIIILPSSKIDGAYALAQKIREKVQNHKFKTSQQITSSFGVTQIKEDDTIEDILHRADKALYVSKDNGRNQVNIVL